MSIKVDLIDNESIIL